MFEFDTGLAPSVGQQVTIPTPVVFLGRQSPLLMEEDQVRRLVDAANRGECDLVVRGVPDPPHGMLEAGFLYVRGTPVGTDGVFLSWIKNDPSRTLADLLALRAPSGWLTFTCAPPGSGPRFALDRDCDGKRDFEDSRVLDPIGDRYSGASFCTSVAP